MTDGEVEETLLKEIFFYAQHDAGEVTLTQLRNDDADGVGDASAQHTGVQIGPILKFFSSGLYTLPGCQRDGFRDWRVVQDNGNCRGR